MADLVKPDGTPARGIDTKQAVFGGTNLEYVNDPTLVIGFQAPVDPGVVADRLTVYGLYVNAFARELVALREELAELRANAETVEDDPIKLS